MKKIFLLLITTITLRAPAQTSVYHPLLDSINDWIFTDNIFPAEPIQKMTSSCSYPFYDYELITTIDTLINSLHYKKLIEN